MNKIRRSSLFPAPAFLSGALFYAVTSYGSMRVYPHPTRSRPANRGVLLLHIKAHLLFICKIYDNIYFSSNRLSQEMQIIINNFIK